MTQRTADIIDVLAGLDAGNPLSAVRDQRAQARDNAQLSFEALLEPADPGTVPLAERYAVATFVALLHGFAEAAAFYADLLADEAPELTAPIEAAAAAGVTAGPYGAYRESGLQGESREGLRWHPSPETTAAIGGRLAAALTHTHLLVLRPREARPEHLGALADAGWSADDIVTLSQLVAFLSFQLRAAWGLRVLAAHPAPTVSEGE